MSLLTGRIFYEAIKQDAELMEMIGGRIYATAIEVPPTDEDKTPLPYVILMSEPLSNEQSTKDGFEGDYDQITISAEIAADGTDEVLALADKVRHTVCDYLTAVQDGEVESENEHLLPEDYQFSASGVAWDWMKPCHFMTLSWACDTKRD